MGGAMVAYDLCAVLGHYRPATPFGGGVGTYSHIGVGCYGSPTRIAGTSVGEGGSFSALADHQLPLCGLRGPDKVSACRDWVSRAISSLCGDLRERTTQLVPSTGGVCTTSAADKGLGVGPVLG